MITCRCGYQADASEAYHWPIPFKACRKECEFASTKELEKVRDHFEAMRIA